MPKYKDTYTRDGIDFHVTEKHEIICLLVGTYRHSPTLHTYEVHLLRMVKQGSLSPDAGKMLLSSPSESDWGKYGWTFMTLEDAQRKFDQLADESEVRIAI
jgi:hypothetical protein